MTKSIKPGLGKALRLLREAKLQLEDLADATASRRFDEAHEHVVRALSSLDEDFKLKKAME